MLATEILAAAVECGEVAHRELRDAAIVPVVVESELVVLLLNCAVVGTPGE